MPLPFFCPQILGLPNHMHSATWLPTLKPDPTLANTTAHAAADDTCSGFPTPPSRSFFICAPSTRTISLSLCLSVLAPATTAMASGIFATPFGGSWDRLMKRMTEPTKRPEPAPTLPIIDAADDDWALGTTSSLHLALAKAKAAFVSKDTTATTLAPARLATKPIIMATDQGILPPALYLPSISDSTSGWADDLTSMLRLFSSTLIDLTIAQCAPIPAPIVETPGVISDDDLSEYDSSASDTSFDSLFDIPSHPASPHTDQSTSISNSSSSSLDSVNHNAALILCSEAFTLVPCTLEPRPGDIGGRTISGFLTFPNLNYKKPETIDDDDTEAVFDTSCHELEAWNIDSFSGATAARIEKMARSTRLRTKRRSGLSPTMPSRFTTKTRSEDSVHQARDD